MRLLTVIALFRERVLGQTKVLFQKRAKMGTVTLEELLKEGSFQTHQISTLKLAEVKNKICLSPLRVIQKYTLTVT